MSLFDLPLEIFEGILEQAEIRDHQAVVWSLMNANPRATIHPSHLFQSIRVTHPRQAILLYNILRKNVADNQPYPISWIRNVLVECWDVDADIVINLLRLIPRIQTLSIWIGPRNFSPEHLDELFEKPIRGLEVLSIRFRPYVEKANYYQFLKGAYFDSLLISLSKWPGEDCPPILSIVQDQLSQDAAGQAFAQPIVFFRLDTCLSIFLHSEGWSSSLTSFRLRLPSRPVIRSMCGIPMAAGMIANNANRLPPDIEFLDLSTCAMLDSEVDTVLMHFPNLKHLILDGCPILRGELHEGDWNALGKRCAIIGSKRAKEREKTIKAWAEARNRAIAQAAAQDASQNVTDAQPTPAQALPTKRAKRGRKGLASSSLKIREKHRTLPVALPPRLPDVKDLEPVNLPKVRILPSAPALLSLSITRSSSIQTEKILAIRDEFEAGWAEGIALLGVTRARLRTSAKNGHVRLVQFTSLEEMDELQHIHDGFDGLEYVDPDNDQTFWGAADAGSNRVLSILDAPILCFAGDDGRSTHLPNCGHSVARKMMGEI